MTARRIAAIALTLAAVAFCTSVFFTPQESPDPEMATTGETSCNSCDARHQNLSKLRALKDAEEEGHK